jgi:hypothetical protein
MKMLFKLLIPVGFVALSGCVVAPYGYGYGYHHRYYGPRVAVYGPAPVRVGPPVLFGPPVLVVRP